MMKCFILLAFSTLTFLCPVYSQVTKNFSFTHVGLSEGLSQSTVTDITQDKNGNIWFATHNGLNKYNGYDITIYSHNESDSCSIADNIIRTCHRDLSDNIWAGTAHGLSLYNTDKSRFKNFIYTTGNCDVKGISDFDDNKLLLFIDNGLVVFDRTQGIFLENELPAELSAIQPTSLGQQGNNVYIGSREGVFIYSIVEKSLTSLRFDELKGKVILAILQESATRLWIGTEGSGLYLFNPQSEQFVHYVYVPGKQGVISSNYIRALAFDHLQQLWIGTTNSLNIYNTKDDSFYVCTNTDQDENGLSHKSVRSLFKDSQGGVWVGTYWGGANYYHPLKKRFQELKFPAGHVDNSVIGCIHEDCKGNLWIGTNEEGVNCYDPHTGHVVRYTEANGLGSNDVKSIYIDDTNELVYVGTHAGGLNIIHRKNGRIEIPQKALKNIYAIEPTEKGNLWISALSNIFLYDVRSKNLTRLNNVRNILKSGITFIYRDSKRRLWIGGKNGVDIFDEKNEKLICRPLTSGREPFRLKYINCVYETHDGIFWIATRSGLYRYDELTETTKLYTTAEGLPDNVIHDILEDEFGNLWLGTDKGLVSLQPDTETFRNYTDIDGLRSNQFTQNSFCRTRSGRIYMGGINGITGFHPAQLVDNPYTPHVIITQLLLFNKPVQPDDITGILQKDISNTQSITLTAQQKMFSLQFVVSNYIAGIHNTFAYKLKGYDNEWYYTNMRTVSYSNLPQGTYRFLVKAANNDGKWNDTPTELEIIILPIWYKTWWAILLFTLLISATISLIIRYFWAKKMMHAQILLERKDKERQKEINEMKLSFFINIAHELRTPLTLILAPLSELLTKVNDRRMYKQLEYISNSTNRLLHLVNQLMDYRRAELGIFKLNVYSNKIYNTIQKTVSLYDRIAQEKNIYYHFDTDIEHEAVYCDPEYVELILNNLLSNAFKYTSENGNIQVKLALQTGQLLLSVQDTGCGIPADKQQNIFERFYQVKNAAMSSGIGLSVVKRLVDMHHGHIELQSKEGEGSTFTILLPTDAKAYAPEEIAPKNKPEIQEEAFSAIPSMFVNKNPEETTSNTTTELTTDDSKTKKNILIVEDNPDILRFLTDELGEIYNIWEARHGSEALEVVNEQEIDLILTDIMMPVMDGLQLCTRIKQNVRTCHIPVIILSAKADMKEQLEGLQTGADDYITKPFAMAVMKAKIQNMFRTRYRSLQHYSKSLEVEPEKMSLNSIDEALLKKAKNIVEQHMDDADFSTEAFAREMCMSRSNLHLKIKAITGESSYDFIRKIRFNKACKLLLEGSYTIAEISSMVGFNVPSYFSTSFKKYFGCLPTEYAQKKKKNLQI